MVQLKRKGKYSLAGLLLLVVLMQIAVPMAAADTTTITAGNYTISSDGIYQLDSGYSGAISVADSVYQATIIGDAGTTFDARIEIESRNSDLDLVIQDLKINAAGQGIYLNTAANNVDVYLYISGECSVQATGAAISTPGGTNVIIDSYSGDDDRDTLTAISTGRNAGIGGADGDTVGSITIAGGTVTANGGYLGAGIGGGDEGDGGIITIGGGKVTASGGVSGAGIGGGSGGSGGTIEISGGTVTANGGYLGAGIGGGSNDNGGTIEISGGTVTANGGGGGAGIGGGYGMDLDHGSGGTVTISNHPTIIATGDTTYQAQNIGHGTACDVSSGTLQDSYGNDLSYLRFHVTDVGSNDIFRATVKVDGNDYVTNDDGLTGCTVLLDGSTAQDYSAYKPGYYITKTDRALPSAMNVEVPVALEAGIETDLAVDVAYSGSHTVGESGAYTVTVTNNGPAASSSVIAVSDPIPAAFTADTCAGSGWTCNMAGVLTANYSSSLAAGASASFTVTGTITGSAGSILSNTATVSTGDTDPDSSNNSDTETFTIQVPDAVIAPITATFDKYSGSANYQDIAVSMTLNGNTLSSIKNGGTALTAGTDYTVSGNTATINKSYLEQQTAGTTTLTFDFSAGADQTLVITISDSTPAFNDSSISPTTVSFDKYSGSANYQDIAISMTLNGNTLSSIKNGVTDLTQGTDYTISSSTVTINKSYLTQQATGTTTLTFGFSAGTGQTLVITISDSTPSSSGGGGGSSSRAVNSSSGSAQVYPSKGGKISLGDEVTLDIPKGALQGNARVPVTIKKTDISQALPSSFMLLGQAYEFQVGGESSYNFDEPVTLTFTFDPDKVPPGEIPAIYYYDPVTLQWVKLGGTISGNTITIEIDHFTTFAVLVEQSGAGNGTEEISFSDIDGHWAETAIEELTAQGSIGGYPDETFRPDRPITRAEFVSVLVKALDLPSTDSSTAFSDIENHWARDDINIAVANGFINGYNDNTFKPDDPITREQMANIIVKAAKLEVSSEESSFADNDDISPWVRGSVTAAVDNGLMGGYPDNTFNPRGQATRAEAVTVIMKLIG